MYPPQLPFFAASPTGVGEEDRQLLLLRLAPFQCQPLYPVLAAALYLEFPSPGFHFLAPFLHSSLYSRWNPHLKKIYRDSLSNDFRNQIICYEIGRLCLPGFPITQNLSRQDLLFSLPANNNNFLLLLRRRKGLLESDAKGLWVLAPKCASLHVPYIWIKGEVTAEEILPVGRTQSISCALASIRLEAQTPSFSFRALPAW